jgi:hypothetical protein
MALDLFNTRSMTAAVEERRAPKTFLLNTFFSRVEVHDTQEVDIDVIRNKRRLAPFVNPLSEGKLVEHAGYATRTLRPAYIKPKMVTTAADLLQRAIGQSIYSSQTPAQRAASRLTQELADLEDMIIRREEWMAAQALFTGSVSVVGEGLNAVIDFGYSGSHDVTLTGTAVWDNAASDPIADIRAWKSIVAQDSGLIPTDAILGTAARDALLTNDVILDQLDRTHQQTLQVNMTQNGLPDGVTYIGRIEGLDLWTYEEWYLDDSNVEQPMVPTKAVLLGSRRADARMHYGAIMDLDSLAAVKRFPKSWTTNDPSARWVMLQSAPLPVPHQIDAFLIAQVLA